MTREEAVRIIQNEYECVDKDCNIERNCGNCNLAMSSKEPILQAFSIAIKELKQQPCEDAISREAVLDLCDSTDPNYEVRHVKEDVECLPSVQSKVKTGHWRAVYQGDEIIDYRCSECEFGNTFGKGTYRMNYCPNCGAKMES